jgi:serine protease Do
MKRWSLAVACLALGGLCAAFVAGPSLRGQPPAAPAPVKELTSYRDIVKKVLPAVVSIESRVKAPARARGNSRGRAPLDQGQIPEELRRYFEDMPRSQPQDDDGAPPAMGFGSGFIVDPKGVILTNHHVVDGATQVEVTLRDGRKFVSKDVKTDPKTDLAIVRVDAKGGDLPWLELGDSEAMEVGDRVLAVGAPFGLTGSVTSGIISAKGRSLHVNMYEDFLQTDAAINPGNSGGPLVNLDGKVIGINSAIKSRTGGFQGVGLAVASNLAKNIMTQLLRDGVVHRGYLGIQIKDLENPELAGRLGLKEPYGVLVTEVFEDAPGAKSGLQEGDVIVSLAGKPVKDGRGLQTAVAGLPLNQPVDMEVFREGKPRTLHVKVQEQPREYGVVRTAAPRSVERSQDSVRLDKVGLEVTDLTAEQAEALGYKEKARGALVTRVKADSPAYEAGLRRGMLVTKVDQKPVQSAQALKDLLAKAPLEKGALLRVQSPQGGTNFVLLKATASASAQE